MISDCNFPKSKLYNLLVENDKAFTHPLSQALQTRGLSLSDYVKSERYKCKGIRVVKSGKDSCCPFFDARF